MVARGLWCSTGFAVWMLAAGCGSGKQEPRAPELRSWEGSPRCDLFRGQAEPLVVEWPAVDRAKLEALAKRGALVVRYADCRLEVLSACRAEATYAFTAITPKHELETIRSRDALYASLPLGAAGLEGALQRKGALEAELTLVGHFQSSATILREDQLVGDCARATHLLRGFSVGAFKFYAGSEQGATSGVRLAGAGVGVVTSSERELLSEDGDLAQCAGATSSGPPSGCGAVARIELAPLDEGKFCPPKTQWSGDRCKAVGLVCPGGTTPSFGSCAALGLTLPLGATCADRGTCASECSNANLDSCVLALLQGFSVPVERRPSFLDFEHACSAGDSLACYGTGLALLNGAAGAQRNPLTGAQLLGRACASGTPPACMDLGQMLLIGNGVSKNVTKARELFEQACAAGNAAGCLAVGGRALDERRYDAAAAYLDRACVAGAVHACTERGFVASALQRNAEALELYRRGCDNGEPMGCAYLARALTLSDPNQGFDLARRACTGGDGMGCYVSGIAYAEGRGTRVNLDRARVALRSACDAQSRQAQPDDLSDACARLTRLR